MEATKEEFRELFYRALALADAPSITDAERWCAEETLYAVYRLVAHDERCITDMLGLYARALRAGRHPGRIGATACQYIPDKARAYQTAVRVATAAFDAGDGRTLWYLLTFLFISHFGRSDVDPSWIELAYEYARENGASAGLELLARVIRYSSGDRPWLRALILRDLDALTEAAKRWGSWEMGVVRGFLQQSN